MASKPSLFIKLLLASLGLLLGIASILTYFSRASSLLLFLVTTVVIIAVLIIVALFFTLARSRIIPGLEKPIVRLIKLLYPLAILVGKLFGKDKDTIRASFIAVHNNLSELKKVSVDPSEVLLLVPHCLQNADCKFKVTTDVENCRRCGKCVIDDLLELKAEYGFHIAVATGGTLARRKIKDLRPKVVIAVACERDLASGIHDAEQVHVLGVTNERPFGPCFNTTVDVVQVEEALKGVIS